MKVDERLFPLMREMGEIANKLRANSQQLSPRVGEIAIGGAHMDPLFRAVGLEQVLRTLRQGGGIDWAIDSGKLAAKHSIQKWNDQREWQVHRWENGVDSFLDGWQRRLEEEIK